MYTLRLAIKNQTPFISGNALGESSVKNVSEEDFIASQMIDPLGRAWIEKNPLLQEEKGMEKYLRSIGYSYELLQEWAMKNYDRLLTKKDLLEDTQFSNPISDGHIAQRIFSKISLHQDQISLEEIIKSVKEKNRILVMNGGSVYYAHHAALTKILGSPKIIILKSEKIKSYHQSS